MGFACLAWLHNHLHPHQTGDLAGCGVTLGVSPKSGGKFYCILARIALARSSSSSASAVRSVVLSSTA